jgi:hypothetical protein
MRMAVENHSESRYTMIFIICFILCFKEPDGYRLCADVSQFVIAGHVVSAFRQDEAEFAKEAAGKKD